MKGELCGGGIGKVFDLGAWASFRSFCIGAGGPWVKIRTFSRTEIKQFRSRFSVPGQKFVFKKYDFEAS